MYVTPGNSCPPRAPSQVLRAPWLRPRLSAHRPRGGEAAPWHRCGPCTASPAQRGREARLGSGRHGRSAGPGRGPSRGDGRVSWPHTHTHSGRTPRAPAQSQQLGRSGQRPGRRLRTQPLGWASGAQAPGDHRRPRRGSPERAGEPRPRRTAHAHAQLRARLSEAAPGTAERSAQAPPTRRR